MSARGSARFSAGISENETSRSADVCAPKSISRRPAPASDRMARDWDYRRAGHSLVAEAANLANRVVVMSPRPGRIVETLHVDLPSDRDYAGTMKRPEFIRVANRARDLLGSSSGAD